MEGKKICRDRKAKVRYSRQHAFLPLNVPRHTCITNTPRSKIEKSASRFQAGHSPTTPPSIKPLHAEACNALTTQSNTSKRNESTERLKTTLLQWKSSENLI